MPDLTQTLADVPSLNLPDLPFAFSVQGETIVGDWDIVDAQYATLTAAGSINEHYSVAVEFDQRKGTYDLTDRTESGETEVSLRDGKLSFGGEREFFKGKTTRKSFSFEAGGIYRKASQEGLAPYLTTAFDTERIKAPLRSFLEQHGWSRKKGFLGGLFG